MIEIKNLQKIIDQRTVVDISDLTVQAGEVVTLIGPVGSGKSELVEMLTGQARPSAGSVRVAGADPIAERDQFSRRVGVLFAEDGLYQQRSPLGNLQFHARLHGLPKSKAQDVLERVGLADHGKARMDKLTTGLSRRLAFGRAILHDPNTIILVDPFARCDEPSINLLSGLIRSLAESKVAILTLADDSTLFEPISDVIHTLTEGRIVGTVNPSDIYFADAEEGRADLHTTDGETLPTQFTLSDLEGRLARSGFFRAHRGYLVNLQHVTEVIPFTRNSFSLRLGDPESTLIPLSKTAASELKDLLDY